MYTDKSAAAQNSRAGLASNAAMTAMNVALPPSESEISWAGRRLGDALARLEQESSVLMTALSPVLHQVPQSKQDAGGKLVGRCANSIVGQGLVEATEKVEAVCERLSLIIGTLAL